MKIVYSEDHRQHFAQGEIYGGEFVTPFERPSRIEYVLRELKRRKMNDFLAPDKLDMRPVRKVHDKGFLEFLEGAWDEWIKAGYRGEVCRRCFRCPGFSKRSHALLMARLAIMRSAMKPRLQLALGPLPRHRLPWH